MNASNILGELHAALWAELCKARRAKTLWLTALAFVFIALIVGLFMFILKYPELASRLGLVGAKAQLLGGTADWASLLNLMLLMVSVGGLVVFGFIFVWLFGREFADRTVYDALALPTSRASIVVAKIITAALWSLALVLLAFVLMLGIGAALHLPGWLGAAVLTELWRMLAVGLLTLLVCLPFALLASLTRGYLPGVGGIFVALFIGQVTNTLGYSQYFPWAVPMLYTGAAATLTGGTAEPLGAVSYILVLLVGIASFAALVLWWRNADQS